MVWMYSGARLGLLFAQSRGLWQIELGWPGIHWLAGYIKAGVG
jgi:hypothetical protein